MARTKNLALLAAATLGFSASSALAGGPDTYANAVEDPEVTSITTVTAAAPPLMETYVTPEPVVSYEPPKDGYYDAARYGGNDAFGYKQSAACGGVLDGEHCLVLLNDHMRRVRLERPAGTILVGNPLIADVTVLGKDTIFVSARTIGSTNIIVLDKDGNEIVTYEVFVREPRTKRVKLRNADTIAHYQCAPYCERALTQSETPFEHGEAIKVISADLSADQTAIGLQSGPNPNTEAEAFGGAQPPAAPLPGAGLPGAGPAAPAAGAAPGGPGAGLAAATQGIAGPGLSLMNSLLGGSGFGAPAPAAPEPAIMDAPPLPN